VLPPASAEGNVFARRLAAPEFLERIRSALQPEADILTQLGLILLRNPGPTGRREKVLVDPPRAIRDGIRGCVPANTRVKSKQGKRFRRKRENVLGVAVNIISSWVPASQTDVKPLSWYH
jgi:hypothetical protein